LGRRKPRSFHPQQIHLTKGSRVPRRRFKTVTVSRTKWRLARAFSVLVLVLAIGAMGFHPRTRRREAGANTVPPHEVHLPHLSFGRCRQRQLTVLPNSRRPRRRTPRADAAAAKVAKKVDPGLVDHHVDLRQPERHRRRHGHDLDLERLVLTNNHVVEDAATLSVRDVEATNTTYVGTVVGYEPLRGRSAHPIEGASGLTTIKDRELRQRLPRARKIVASATPKDSEARRPTSRAPSSPSTKRSPAGDETNPAGSEHLQRAH